MQMLMNYVNSWLSKDLITREPLTTRHAMHASFFNGLGVNRCQHLNEALRLFTKSLTPMSKSVIPVRQVFQMAAGVGRHAHLECSRLDKKLIERPYLLSS